METLELLSAVNAKTSLDMVGARLEALHALASTADERSHCAPVRASTAAKIMIVDDEPVTMKVVRRYLREAGYASFVITDRSQDALELVASERPDVVLLDLLMPVVGGLEILRRLRGNEEFAAMPVIILTAADDQDLKRAALELGAIDFLHKPVDPVDLVPRVRNVLAVKAYQDHLQNYARELEHQVRQRTAELEASRLDVIYCLARAAEYRDNDTGRHVIRVGRFVGVIARALGLDEATASLYAQAAPLHDMGKIGIPDAVLLKPGALDPDEWAIMQKHTYYGCDIVSNMGSYESPEFPCDVKNDPTLPSAPRSSLLQTAATIALTHHERWDGSGYPRGLKGPEIPLPGRITTVADVFDALTSQRPYKAAMPLEECLAIMERSRGSHFDPAVLDAFFSCLETILRIRAQFPDVDTDSARGARYTAAAADTLVTAS